MCKHFQFLEISKRTKVDIYTLKARSSYFLQVFLQEPKPILRYALDECLNVWINEDWENLELYHMKNNAAENNY